MYESLKALSHLVQDRLDVKAIYSVYGNTHVLDFFSKEHPPYSMSITCTADKLALIYHFKSELNREFDYVDVENNELFNEAVDCIVEYFAEVLPNTTQTYQVAINENMVRINELEIKNQELIAHILKEYQKILDKSTTDLNNIKHKHDSISKASDAQADKDTDNLKPKS